MSIEASNAVWDMDDVPPDQKLVLLAMADRANSDGSEIYPSVEWLVRKTGYKTRQVRYAIAALLKSGALAVQTQSAGGRGNKTKYRINYAHFAQITPDETVHGLHGKADETVHEPHSFGPETVQSTTAKLCNPRHVASNVRPRVLNRPSEPSYKNLTSPPAVLNTSREAEEKRLAGCLVNLGVRTGPHLAHLVVAAGVDPADVDGMIDSMPYRALPSGSDPARILAASIKSLLLDPSDPRRWEAAPGLLDARRQAADAARRQAEHEARYQADRLASLLAADADIGAYEACDWGEWEAAMSPAADPAAQADDDPAAIRALLAAALGFGEIGEGAPSEPRQEDAPKRFRPRPGPRSLAMRLAMGFEPRCRGAPS